MTARNGPTGGTITTLGTIAADSAYLQRRVAGTCVVGSFVQAVASDGTVSCGVDARLLASNAFDNLSVPAAGSAVANLATLSFTPGRSGMVRVVSHGHFLQGQLNTETEIGIAAGISESDAFAVSAARIGVLKLSGSVSPLGEFSGAWTSEREYTVTAGAFTTVHLYGRHSVDFAADACSGWFKVEGPVQ